VRSLGRVPEVDLLESALDKTVELVAGVPADQRDRPTPCPEYDVAALVTHVVGWAQVFADAAQGERSGVDPAAYRAADPAQDFRVAASRMVDGWRRLGLERTVPMAHSDLPGDMVFSMTLMEYVVHGWDLAVATGRPVPYTDEEAEAALARARRTLAPEYRGPDTSFGAEVEVPATAPAADRLAGFLGRRPPTA
jgi:uncharacterized protein (TIGR03086 family)